jgi:hypothetical protein
MSRFAFKLAAVHATACTFADALVMQAPKENKVKEEYEVNEDHELNDEYELNEEYEVNEDSGEGRVNEEYEVNEDSGEDRVKEENNYLKKKRVSKYNRKIGSEVLEATPEKKVEARVQDGEVTVEFVETPEKQTEARIQDGEAERVLEVDAENDVENSGKDVESSGEDNDVENSGEDSNGENSESGKVVQSLTKDFADIKLNSEENVWEALSKKFAEKENVWESLSKQFAEKLSISTSIEGEKNIEENVMINGNPDEKHVMIDGNTNPDEKDHEKEQHEKDQKNQQENLREKDKESHVSKQVDQQVVSLNTRENLHLPALQFPMRSYESLTTEFNSLFGHLYSSLFHSFFAMRPLEARHILLPRLTVKELVRLACVHK